MHLLVLGLSHKTSPLEVRERLIFSRPDRPAALAQLKSLLDVHEACLLSTCNRTEIYCVSEDIGALRQALISFLAESCNIDEGEFLGCLYEYVAEECVAHLFRVASGIDSMIIGESEVMAQVKETLEEAEKHKSAGPMLHALYREALRMGKQARTQTDVSRGGLSVASVAVDLAESIFGQLRGRRAMILGAGETSETTLKHLRHQGVSTVIVANRTYERAVELAERFGGRAIRYDSLVGELAQCDILISSTSAQRAILDKLTILEVMRARRGRPLFIIDIAVPRDIDPRVNALDNVYLYNIDDLQQVVQRNLEERQKEIEKVETIIQEGVAGFMKWSRGRTAIPLIVSLRDKIEKMREEELEAVLNKLQPLSDTDKSVVESLTKSLVNRILSAPVTAVKEFASAEDADYRLQLARELFGLIEEARDREGVDVEKKDAGRKHS